MDVEGKGFVIKDKRSFDAGGELKEEEKTAGKKEADQKAARERTADEDSQRGPLPEVNFISLIFSLSSSALLNVGEIADPQTGQKKKDLPLAKHSIDTIAMLRDKTKGNLNDEEEKFVNSVLTDLRLRYVKAKQ